jgi:hypothetical protein
MGIVMAIPFLWGSQIPFSSAIGNPHVTALSNGTFLVIGKTEATTPSMKMRAWIYNADGSLKEERILESAYYPGFWENLVHGASSHSVVELPDGRIALTWSIVSSSPGYTGAWMGLYGSDLKPIGKPIPFAGIYDDPQSQGGEYKDDDAIGLGDGSVIVTYRSLGGEAFLRILSPTGVLSKHFPLGQTLPSDHDKGFGSVMSLAALSDEKVAIALRDSDTSFQVFIFDPANEAGPTLSPPVFSGTTANISERDIKITALKGGGFVVGWTEMGNVDQPAYIPYVQAFDDHAKPIGNKVSVAGGWNYWAALPDVVALPNGDFAVAYEKSTRYNGVSELPDVYLSIFNPEKGRISEEMMLNEAVTAGSFDLQGLSLLRDGRLVVQFSGGIRIVDPRQAGQTVTGTGFDDQYIGSGFGDALSGAAGADHLRGDGGNDTLDGGAGADILNGGDGFDFVSFASSVAGVSASLAGASGDGVGDTWISIEGIVGSNHADTLTGSGAAQLQGGADHDIYKVRSGDVVTESAGGGRDTVLASSSYTLSASAEVEVLKLSGVSSKRSANLTGSDSANEITGHGGTNTLRGLSGNDVLKAAAGNDTLKGDTGSDKLYGGTGNDKLYGGTGSGKDVFVFDTKLSKTKNVDRVYDFNTKYDSFHLENKIFTKLGKDSSKGVKFKADMFVKGKAAGDREDRIIYDKGTGALYYDKDGTGSAAQVKIATLNKNLKIYFHDFYVI